MSIFYMITAFFAIPLAETCQGDRMTHMFETGGESVEETAEGEYMQSRHQDIDAHIGNGEKE